MVEEGGGGGAMSFLKRVPPPAEGGRHQRWSAVLWENRVDKAALDPFYNSSLFFFIFFFFSLLVSRLSWLENSGVGFSLDYPTISLHAVSRDLSAYPWEHLYVMVNAKFEEETKEAPMAEGEEEDSDDDVEPIAEFRFVPSDKSALEAMFSAMCECQALHPDPDDEDSDNDYEGDEYDVEARELEQGDIPSFYTYEEGLSHLTAEGQATLERLEGMLAQSVSSQYNMAGVRTEDSIREFEDGMEVDVAPVVAGQFEDAEVDH
ncbi:PREDICTED: methylosome subunit pICln [Charadrius vociferus]|uniref:methylosome subunit pICln n=1 Tax=Charadrius vociferus TaxID=50402 RepID=UPI000521C0B4|nr:PREDICTED: methylosome subunit pICln [Charadrius vociferus]